MGKTVVVLGANSFSGQDFVDLLLNNTDYEKVIGVSRSPEKSDIFISYKKNSEYDRRYKYFQIDFNSQIDELLLLLDKERPNYIVNFAAQSEVAPSWEHPEHWFQTNTVSLAKMVNHIRRYDYLEKYLHVSSPEAYGSCSGNVTEDTYDNPSTPYAASKAAADMLLSVYRKQFGFPVVTVRATNVYGARQQLFKIIPRTAIYLKQNKFIELHGGGVAVKSYIHIRDVSRGELSILENGRVGERYHLSPDAGISVKDVVSTICSIMGKDFFDSTKIVAERPGQDAAYVIDSTKARSQLGWSPQISMKDGLLEVINWVEEYWSQIQKESLVYNHKE